MLPSFRIAELLAPFRVGLSPAQLDALSRYLDLLLRWNARLNLTSVRDSEHIVTRHIGESLFTASQLFGNIAERETGNGKRVLDLGSGAGFPGLPMKIYAPSLRLTLIESQHKKATFLREAIRALQLQDIDVFAGRAEEFAGRGERADVVTMRAVERFDAVLPLAASLLVPRVPPLVCHPEHGEGPTVESLQNCHPERAQRVAGPTVESLQNCHPERAQRVEGPCVCLLVGAAQLTRAQELLPHFHWRPPVPIPLSSARVVLIGTPDFPLASR